MPYMLDGRRLRVGRPFKTTDGVSYSQLWATQLTAEEKTAIGITYTMITTGNEIIRIGHLLLLNPRSLSLEDICR